MSDLLIFIINIAGAIAVVGGAIWHSRRRIARLEGDHAELFVDQERDHLR